MVKRYIAIRKNGSQIGVFDGWLVAEPLVRGRSKAVYQGFDHFKDAYDFVHDPSPERGNNCIFIILLGSHYMTLFFCSTNLGVGAYVEPSKEYLDYVPHYKSNYAEHAGHSQPVLGVAFEDVLQQAAMTPLPCDDEGIYHTPDNSPHTPKYRVGRACSYLACMMAGMYALACLLFILLTGY